MKLKVKHDNSENKINVNEKPLEKETREVLAPIVEDLIDEETLKVLQELDEDEAMEREHYREVEKEKEMVEKDLERMEDNFGRAGY